MLPNFIVSLPSPAVAALVVKRAARPPVPFRSVTHLSAVRPPRPGRPWKDPAVGARP